MNPYETLDVPKDAGADDIKKSYRKLAAMHHPDKGGKHEDFLNIQRAYETLSDPAARARYDETGAMSDEPTMFEKCMVELLRMAVHFVEQINDIESNDLIGIMKQNIRDALQKIHKERANTQLLIEKLRNSAKRFKAKGDKNPFQMAIEVRAKNLEITVETMDRHAKAAEMSLDILKDYSYEFTSRDAVLSAWLSQAHAQHLGGSTNLR